MEAELKFRDMDCEIASQIVDPQWNLVSEIRPGRVHYLSRCCHHCDAPQVCNLEMIVMDFEVLSAVLRLEFCF